MPLPRVLRVASVALMALVIAACSSESPSASPAATTGAPIDAEQLVVAPATVLLTNVGETRQLGASIVHEGTPATTGATWTSSDTAIVDVSGDGLVTARGHGSAQVTATRDGLAAAPVLVVVVQLGEGVAPVADEQVLSDPADTDPEGDPAADATYEVVLGGDAPRVGDRLVGTGGKALAGEVVAVTAASGGNRVTMRLVPLAELLPGLELEEVLDLANAPVAVPADVAELFDVTRSGNRFDFAPKANYAELVGRASGGAQLAGFGGPLLGLPVGTSAAPVPPFHDCKGSIPSLPVGLPQPPSFSVEIQPTLDVAWSADELQHWIVRAKPKATVKLALKVEAAFEGTYTCKRELFLFQVPVAGALSLFISGLVPVGVGFELAGKVTLATAGIGADASVATTAAIGIDCATGSCEGVREMGEFETKLEPKVDVQSPGDLRFEPSFQVFAYTSAEVGNRFLRRLRFEAVSAKVGAELAADWAPMAVQIEDPGYASSFGLKGKAGASIGPRVGELAEMLGLDGIRWAALSLSTDLETSPTGTYRADRQTYQTGDTASVHVTLAEDGLQLFETLYDVKRVILVLHSGGRDDEVATVDANDGQREFDLSFQTRGPVNAGDLYAFVVASVAPWNFFAMELSAEAPQPTGTPRPTAPGAEGVWQGTLSIVGANPVVFDVDLVTTSNPSETEAFGEITFDTFSLGQIPFINATGTIRLEILRDLRVNLRQLEIRNGPGMAPCTLQFTGLGTINEAGDRIVVPVDGTGNCGQGEGELVLEHG